MCVCVCVCVCDYVSEYSILAFPVRNVQKSSLLISKFWGIYFLLLTEDIKMTVSPTWHLLDYIREPACNENLFHPVFCGPGL